ncbi:MAG: hypothetical protein U1F43_34635 [Myxococcota bacterium]
MASPATAFHQPSTPLTSARVGQPARRIARGWMMATPLAVLLSGGCLDAPDERTALPLDTASLGFTAAANLRSAASAWTDATDWVADAELASWLGDLTSGAADATAPGVDDPPMSGDGAPKSPAAIADELADRLENDFLVVANLESSDATSATYLIPAASACDVEASPEPGSADADCLRRFTAIPLRLRVVSYAAQDLDIALLVGDVRLAPLTIELHHQSLALTVDVAEAFAAFRLLDVASGDGHDVVLRSAKGQLRTALERRGEHQARATFEVSSPLVIDADVNGYAVSASLARSSVTVDLDGQARRVTVDGTLGTLRAAAPFQLVSDLAAGDGEEPAAVSGALALDLAGASAKVVLDADADALSVQGLGLGDHRSTLTLDGATLIGVDLNAASGRRLDLTLTTDPDGARRVSVSPVLNVVVTTGLRALAPIDRDLAESWAADETLGLALDGAAALTCASATSLAVVAGRLALASRSRPDLSLEVTAGMCLASDGAGDDAAAPVDEGASEPAPHPFAGLSASPCDAP